MTNSQTAGRSPRPTVRRRRRGSLLTSLCVVGVAAAAATAQSTDPRFRVTSFATGLTQPVAIAFAPDGRLFIAQKEGAVRIIENGVLLPQEFVRLDVHSFLESGLLGIELDPDFASNHYVYLFATVSLEEQVIIRYTDSANVGVDPLTLRDNIPSLGTFHNGGCLKFGPDNKLYFSVGDNTIGDNSQNLSTLAGKICRINSDGSTPDDNPFSTPTGAPRAAWALGFRNPFRFCFASDGRMFLLDVGSDLPRRREEINVVRVGDNCGWPVVEGGGDPAAHPGFVFPIYEYVDEGSAPTGAVYYTADKYPAEFRGNLFHLEYTLNRLYRVVLDGDAVVSHTTFVQGEGGPTDLAVGPDGNLYYCEVIGGAIRRVSLVDDDESDITPVIEPPGVDPTDGNRSCVCGVFCFDAVFVPISWLALAGFIRRRMIWSTPGPL